MGLSLCFLQLIHATSSLGKSCKSIPFNICHGLIAHLEKNCIQALGTLTHFNVRPFR